MAINRFMQPWKRDFSTEHYIPNFDAWAKGLQQKELDHNKVLEDADKIASLIPEGGYATQEKRQELLSAVKGEVASITEELNNPGVSNINDARRRISRLANETLNNPWISALKMDQELKPIGAKLATSQTIATDVQGAYDPKTKQFKQAKDVKEVGPGFYSNVETQDTYSMFRDVVKQVPNAFVDVSTMGFDDIEVVETKNEDGTTDKSYFLKGKDVQRTFKDVNELRKVLDPNGIYGDHAKFIYESLENDKRAYYDAKYKHLTPDKKEQKFYEDLFDAALIDIFDKTVVTEKVQEVRGSKKGKEEGAETPVKPHKIMSYEDTQPVRLQNVGNLGNMISTVITERKSLTQIGTAAGKTVSPNNVDVDKLNKELKAKISKGLDYLNPGEVDHTLQDVFEKDDTGKFIIHPVWKDDKEVAQMLLEPTSYNGKTISDQMQAMNNEITSRKNQLDVREDILYNHLGLGRENENVIQEIYQKAEKRAETRFWQGRNAGEVMQLQELRKKSQAEYDKKVGAEIRQIQNEIVEEEIETVFPGNPVMKKKFKEANDYLVRTSEEVNPVKTNYFHVYGDTPEGIRSVEMINQAMRTAITVNQNHMRMGDELIVDEDQRKAVADALNNFFENPGKGTDNHFKEYQQDVGVFFDKEEGIYKMRVNLLNQALADELEIKSGAAFIEVPFPKNTRIGDQTMEQYLGIEGSPELVSRMHQIEQDFTNNKNYISTSQDGDHSTTISLDVYDPKRNTGVLEARMDIRLGNNTKHTVRLPSTRHAAELDLFIKDIKNLPVSEENIENAAQYIMNKSQGSVPEDKAFAIARQAIGTNIIDLSTIKSPYFTVKEGEDVTLNRHSVSLLNKLGRDLYGTGTMMELTSGHRDQAENDAVGGAATSAHLSGMAFDVSTLNGNAEVVKSVEKIIGKKIQDDVFYTLPAKYNLRVMKHKGTADHLHFEILN